MKIINKGNLDFMYKLNLHDWQIKHVNCDYDLHIVKIPITKIIDGQDVYKILEFQDVLYSDISYYEPWAAGVYIFEYHVDYDNMKYKNLLTNKNNEEYKYSRLSKIDNLLEYIPFCFVLNSGDKINIVAKLMQYK